MNLWSHSWIISLVVWLTKRLGTPIIEIRQSSNYHGMRACWIWMTAVVIYRRFLWKLNFRKFVGLLMFSAKANWPGPFVPLHAQKLHEAINLSSVIVAMWNIAHGCKLWITFAQYVVKTVSFDSWMGRFYSEGQAKRFKAGAEPCPVKQWIATNASSLWTVLSFHAIFIALSILVIEIWSCDEIASNFLDLQPCSTLGVVDKQFIAQCGGL